MIGEWFLVWISEFLLVLIDRIDLVDSNNVFHTLYGINLETVEAFRSVGLTIFRWDLRAKDIASKTNQILGLRKRV